MNTRVLPLTGKCLQFEYFLNIEFDPLSSFKKINKAFDKLIIQSYDLGVKKKGYWVLPKK